MTGEPLSFMDYWEAVDAAMLKLFAIDTGDAGIEADLIAAAQEEGQTPEEFALWLGEKAGLNTVAEWKASWGCP
jgi:ATP phosphoribosyltransferase regulatory subunit HisZ